MVKIKLGPWRCEILRGDPIQAGGWRLTPIVGLMAHTHRHATIGDRSTTAAGAQLACIRPLALEATANGRRRLVLLPDVTRLLIGAVCLCGLVSWLIALRFACRGKVHARHE